MLLVNVRGRFAGPREAAQRMTGGGVIVNLTSTAGFKAGISAYVASKHAVVGITKALARAGARSASGFSPSHRQSSTRPASATRWRRSLRAGVDVEARVAANPLGRMGVPDDVARVVLFCCSDMSAFMTGSTAAVDAGSLC
jgi:NAD(P)-dependent dehydrogenase (short-subunit alcohol dehydrogenase family)